MAQLTFSGGINQREHGDLANMVGISVMLKQKRQTKIFLHFSFSWSVGWYNMPGKQFGKINKET